MIQKKCNSYEVTIDVTSILKINKDGLLKSK